MKSYTHKELTSIEMVQYKPKFLPNTDEKGIYWGLSLDEKNFFIQYNSCQEDPYLSMQELMQLIQ